MKSFITCILRQVKEDEMGIRCYTNWQKRNAYEYMLLVGKPEGKRLLGMARCGCVDNIKMDLGEIGWGNVYWVGLVQDATMKGSNIVSNLQVPYMLGRS
jgi:hypothetical protein